MRQAAAGDKETVTVDREPELDLASEDVPVEVQKALLDNEIAMWVNSKWQIKMRYEVHKALDEKDQMETVRKDMERIVKAIELLKRARKKLEPTPAA